MEPDTNDSTQVANKPEEGLPFLRLVAIRLKESSTRAETLKILVVLAFKIARSLLFTKEFGFAILAGILIGAVLAAGQTWSIGFYPAWKLYKIWWFFSPLYGLALLSAGGLLIAVLEGVEWLLKRAGQPRLGKWVSGLLLLSMLVVGIFVAGYFGAREDNPMLSSQPANLDALTKAVGEQKRVVGNLSVSGKALLDQLTATELELANAKRQLSVTLANFDSQEKAAGQVSEELKRIDARQKEIVTESEQLERILEGQKPITRRDLQRANWQGWISGLVIGFLTSFLASIVYNAVGKRRAKVVLDDAVRK